MEPRSYSQLEFLTTTIELVNGQLQGLPTEKTILPVHLNVRVCEAKAVPIHPTTTMGERNSPAEANRGKAGQRDECSKHFVCVLVIIPALS